MPKAQIMKWGNSLAIRIPKAIAEEARMKEGDAVLIDTVDGHIEVHRADDVPTLKHLVSQITPENRYEESDWGHERGKEGTEW